MVGIGKQPISQSESERLQLQALPQSLGWAGREGQTHPDVLLHLDDGDAGEGVLLRECGHVVAPRLGSDRIVASEREAPNILAHLVK